MSYANATVAPADRAKAAVSVIGIHALLGAGLVLGLAVTNIVTSDDPIIEVTDIPVDIPAPPPPDVIETPDIPPPYVPPAAPRPPVDLTNDAPITVVEPGDVPAPVFREIPTGPITTGPVIIDPPSPPAPAYTPTGPVPANPINRWITTDDYSRSDLMREREGTANYRLVVGSDGRVDACEITRSTGHSSLDRDTCRLIERRARFDPATNNRGENVVGTYTGTVTWQIPD